MVVRETESKRKPRRARKSLSSISKSRWLSYTAAGAATVAAGQQAADAAVVHVDPVDIVLSGAPGGSSSIYLDMNNDGSPDLVPLHFMDSANGQGIAIIYSSLSNPSNALAGFNAGAYFYPSNLPANTAVSAQPMVSNFFRGDMAWRLGYTNSQWLGTTTGASSTGYLGVRFQAADGAHYGWIRATVGPYFQNIFTIHEWGYNDTPDGPIMTGEVPEPGSLGLLALGGAGLLAWRRKRQQAAS